MAQTPSYLNTYGAVVDVFTVFLTVAIHTILHDREVYPRASFIKAKKYNFPVAQNRHPRVCKWITDAVEAVHSELLKCTVSNVSLVIYSSSSIPLERYVFSTEGFPIIPSADRDTVFDFGPTTLPVDDIVADEIDPVEIDHPEDAPIVSQISIIDLTSQFRAILSKLSLQASKFSRLPSDCTYTVAIELRDDTKPRSEPPIGWPQPWISTVPGMQRMEKLDHGNVVGATDAQAPPKEAGEYVASGATVPVRNLEAGPFVMEVWIEEGRDKESVVRDALEKERIATQLKEKETAAKRAKERADAWKEAKNKGSGRVPDDNDVPQIEVAYENESVPDAPKDRKPGSITTTSQGDSAGFRSTQERQQQVKE